MVQHEYFILIRLFNEHPPPYKRREGDVRTYLLLLYGDWLVGLPKSQLIDAIGSLNTDSDNTFRLGRAACSENYYKAVFVETRDDGSLRTLRSNLLALLGMVSQEYSPHMSLMYGTFAISVLATIVASITIPDMPTKIARLDLVPITPDPNEWESIYSLYLMPNQQA